MDEISDFLENPLAHPFVEDNPTWTDFTKINWT